MATSKSGSDRPARTDGLCRLICQIGLKQISCIQFSIGQIGFSSLVFAAAKRVSARPGPPPAFRCGAALGQP